MSAPQLAPLVVPRPTISSRLALRFSVLYFGLFCLCTQVSSSFFIPPLAPLPPVRNVVFWTASHVFQQKLPLVYQGSGSGDKTFDWVLSFGLLVLSLLVAPVWALLDGKHPHDSGIWKWFYLFLRFTTASQFMLYGLVKVVPLQMPYPSLTRLVEPFGNFSPMGVLWYSVGASPSYERFAGSAEVLGAVLLFFPRTTILGALVCLADAVFIFTLNMTYDVPVKLFAFHLILMSLLLLAPDVPRLLRFFLTQREPGPSRVPALFSTPRASRIAWILQGLVALYLTGSNVYGSWKGWTQYGPGVAKSPLYGIWNIDPASVAPGEGWRRLIFDSPSRVAIQKMDDTFMYRNTKLDAGSKRIDLTNAPLKFERSAPDRLTLDGELEGKPLHLSMQLQDRNGFLLVNRGFHWIQEYPFNR